MKYIDLGREKFHLALLFLTLAIPPALYLARHLDDNRLTSWAWVFDAVPPATLFLALAVLAPLLWAFSRFPLPVVRHPLVPALTSFVLSFLFFDVPEVIVDASRYFVQAKFVGEHGVVWFFREWGREIFAWTDLPLMPFLYGVLFAIFDEARLVAQLLNAFFLSLAVYLTCQLGRNLWDEETGILGGWMLMGIRYLYTQVPLLLVDVAAMTALLLAVATWHRALVLGGCGRLLLAALALAAAFWAKYSLWLLLTGLGPFFILAARENPGQALRRVVCMGLAALLLIFPLLAVHADVMASQLELLRDFQRPGLKVWGESLVSTFLFQTHPLLSAGALYSLYRCWKLRDGRYLAVAFLVALVLVVLEVRRIRYSMPIFPFVALLAAYGLRGVQDVPLRRHLVLAVVVPSLLLAWGGFRPFLQGMGESNLQKAGAYLDRLGLEPAAVLVVPPENPVLDPRISLPLLDIFTSRRLFYHPLSPEASREPERVQSAPLRFTWEFSMPSFYLREADGTAPVLIVVGGVPQPELPEQVKKELAGLPVKKEFLETDGVFLHRTYVTVYHKEKLFPDRREQE